MDSSSVSWWNTPTKTQGWFPRSQDAHYSGQSSRTQCSNYCSPGTDKAMGTKVALLRVGPRENLWAGKSYYSQSSRGFLFPVPSDPKDQDVERVGRHCCTGTQGCSRAQEHQTLEVAAGAFSQARCFMHLSEGRGMSSKD